MLCLVSSFSYNRRGKIIRLRSDPYIVHPEFWKQDTLRPSDVSHEHQKCFCVVVVFPPVRFIRNLALSFAYTQTHTRAQNKNSSPSYKGFSPFCKISPVKIFWLSCSSSLAQLKQKTLRKKTLSVGQIKLATEDSPGCITAEEKMAFQNGSYISIEITHCLKREKGRIFLRINVAINPIKSSTLEASVLRSSTPNLFSPQ